MAKNNEVTNKELTKEEKTAELTKKRRKDHRQRVKNKYYESGLKGMAEHNVLEFLLFFGIPQKDTKELSYALLEYFNSFDKVLEAPMSELMKVKGMTENAACLFTMILPLYKYYANNLTKKKSSCMDPVEKIVESIRPVFLDNVCREQLWAFCYDYNGSFVAKRCISIGDISKAPFDMRALASFAIETNCSFLILAHNHPHGVTQPSSADVSATKAANDLLDTLNVKLTDHIILNDTDFVSLAHHPATIGIFYGLENEIPLTTDDETKKVIEKIRELSRQKDIERKKKRQEAMKEKERNAKEYQANKAQNASEKE